MLGFCRKPNIFEIVCHYFGCIIVKCKLVYFLVHDTLINDMCNDTVLHTSLCFLETWSVVQDVPQYTTSEGDEPKT